MTVRRRIVRRTTHAPQSGTSSEKSSERKRPSKPRVDIGPRAYGRTPKGRYITIRFFISNRVVSNRKPSDRWWVLDIEEDENRGIAKGTKKDGYSSKEEAITIAREYRDEYGAYGKVHF